MEHQYSENGRELEGRPFHALTDDSAPRDVALRALKRAAPPLGAALMIALAWQLWVKAAGIPVYIVPSPADVFQRLLGDVAFFAGHSVFTLAEALSGFALGAAVALVAATLMIHSGTLERTLYPLALLVKVTPIVAVAPLFVIWFGFGPTSKVLIAALITFFPVLVNALTGLRAVNSGSLDFFRSVNASTAEIYLKLRAPSSLPYLFAAFRIAVPLSVIGAVVGEWFTGDKGLGHVIIVAHNNLDTPTLFSAVFSLALIGIGLTLLLTVIEKRVLFWHEAYVAP